MSNAVITTVENAARENNRDSEYRSTPATRAKAWFISHYPLLGAIASGFSIVDYPDVCLRMEISVAAVSCDLREIYINPRADKAYHQYGFAVR